MKIFHGNLRRIMTGVFLGAAFLMLILGLTVLSAHLKRDSFLIYWLTCFVLTGLAAILALVDMMIIRRQLREEQRELIRTTLEQAEKDAKDFDESGSKE
jgi:membrane protein implicated in regulation of membrane protease activity